VSHDDPDVPPASSRWASLTAAAFRLDALSTPSLRDARAAIDHVLEVFDATLEPCEDFEGAAVRRFALSLRRALGAAS
jgi:hypothetical protein